MPPYAYKPPTKTQISKMTFYGPGNVPTPYKPIPFNPADLKNLKAVPKSGGGGGSVVRAGGGGTSGGSVPASFLNPVEQQENINRQVNELNTRSSQLQSKVDAFNVAQAAVNAGRPIPPDVAATLGIGSFSQRAGTGAQVKLNSIRRDLSGQQTSLNKDIGTVQKSISVPTAAEQAAKASLIDRGVSQEARIIREKQVAKQVGAGGFTTTSGAIGQAIYPAIQPATPMMEKPIVNRGLSQNFIYAAGESIFGEKGTGIPLVTAKGSIGERGGRAVVTTAYGFAEAGERVGGTPGRAVGSLIGAGAGLGLGVFEGGYGTYSQVAERFTRYQTQNETIAQTVGSFGDIILGARGLTKAPQAAKGIAEFTPKALRAGESFLARGKSIYADTGILGKSAVAFEKFAGTVGKASQPVGRLASKNVVKYPLTFVGSLYAPEVSAQVSTAFETPSNRNLLQSARGQAAINATFQQASLQQASEGFVSQVGGGLGLGYFGAGREKVGGIPQSKVESIARQQALREGFTPSEASRLAPAIARTYKAQQFGGITGQALLSIGTELGGTATIAPILTKGLSGKVVGVGRGSAFKQTVKLTGATLPRFASFGAIEGVYSTAIADLAGRQAKGVGGLPKRIAEQPLNYVYGGAVGAVSAPLLGGLVIGGTTYRALRGGKSAAGKTVERGALYGGYALDPFEQPGDVLANFFGKVEPRFRIRTVQGTPTFTTTTETGGRRGAITTATFFGTPVGVPSTVSVLEPVSSTVPTQTTTPVSTPTNVNTAINTFIGSPLRTPTTTPTEVPTETETETETETTVPTEVPISINVPVGVPVSRAGFPGLFPALPFGGQGGGRGGGRRKTFFNEYRAATSLLGARPLTQGQKIARQRKTLLKLPKTKKIKAPKLKLGRLASGRKR